MDQGLSEVRGRRRRPLTHLGFRLAGAAVLLAAALLRPAPLPAGPVGCLDSLQDLDSAGRGCLAVFRALWLEDELAAQPGLARAPRYHLELELAEDLRQVRGALTLVYTNPLERPISELPLFCYPNLGRGTLEVSSVEVGGTAVQPLWRSEGSVLVVPVLPSLAPAAVVEIRLRYRLVVPEGRPGDRGLFALTDGILSLAHAYPMVPAPAAWPERLPAPYGDFVTNDVAFFTARLDLPEGVELVAPGVELARSSRDGRVEVLIALGPARELYLAAGRGLAVLEQRRGRLTVRSVAFPGFEHDARAVLEAAHEALELFGRRFGPYPFTTFTVLGTPLRALGMEFPGIVLLASSLYGPPDGPDELPLGVPPDPGGGAPGSPLVPLSGSARLSGAARRRFDLEGTLAHEVAHQWFYAMVGTDQLQEPWIDESLAQHAFYLYYRERYGAGAAARKDIEETWERVRRAEIPIGRPLSAYTREEYGPIIYGRAPLFLEALARLMGEERFELFLRELVRRYRWRMIDGQLFRSLAAELCDCGPEAIERLWSAWVE